MAIRGFGVMGERRPRIAIAGLHVRSKLFHFFCRKGGGSCV